jgi:hypothetical protein
VTTDDVVGAGKELMAFVLILGIGGAVVSKLTVTCMGWFWDTVLFGRGRVEVSCGEKTCMEAARVIDLMS